MLLLSYCFPIIPQFSNCTNPPPPLPTTDQMCFVNGNMARNSERQDVLWNIQIVQCKPDEICDPARESQYYGRGLGYVFFHLTCVIITWNYGPFLLVNPEKTIIEFKLFLVKFIFLHQVTIFPQKKPPSIDASQGNTMKNNKSVGLFSGNMVLSRTKYCLP